MKKTLSIFIIFFLVLINAYGAYKIRYLTADDGLSRNFVNDIYKDSKGFIWISTVRGLDRFDGYNFVSFSSNKREKQLPADVINFTMEDNNGDFWIGTENGLYFMDYQTGIFTPAEKKFKVSKPYLNKSFNFIFKDDEGGMWLGHTDGICRLKSVSGEYEPEEIYTGENIRNVIVFERNIYIAQQNHVYRIIKDNNLQYTRLNSDEKIRNLNGIVTALFYDRGWMWIGTNQGLYKYNPSTEALHEYLANPGNPKALSTNSITDIRRGKDGELLIGTLIGLNIYDYQSNTFSIITSDKKDADIRLNNNFISCVYPDNNMIWIGTEKGGVNLLYPDQRFFTNVSNQVENPFSLSQNPVNAIYEDEDGDLWVGTVEGGLNLKKKGTENFIHFKQKSGDKNSLSHNSVSAINQDHLGNYWVATWGFGINTFSKKNKYHPVFRQFSSDEHNNNAVISNFVAAVIPDKINQGVWIGTNIGLDFYDIAQQKFYHILPYPESSKAIKLVTGLLIDSRHNLWVATGNGLFCINLSKSDIRTAKISCRHFHYKLSEPSSKIVEKINCILQGKDGRIWFGSNGNGLYQLSGSPEKPEFIKTDDSDGLIDNVIYSMLEDASGNLWMSTDKGLSACNPDKKSFRSFTVTDGLATNQFYWNAGYKGRDGKFYFGHVSGYTVFDPLKYITPAVTNEVVLTRISVLNEDIFPADGNQSFRFLQFDNSVLSGIKLKESDKAFSVEFSALSYFLPDKIKYAYRLKGFDNEWKEIGADRRFANFTNIKYGNYLFEVKCTNPDGTWSDKINSIEIQVIPPFYKTWWFLGLLIVLILYAIYSFTNYRINSLKKQEIHLKKLVEERTREIEEQKEKVQEATLDKIAFFTNITHEFRTPVTLILGPVERALKLSTNPKVMEQLDIVKRNSRLLLSLINQLMDFRKVDSGKMELSRTKLNFISFLNDLMVPFEDLGKDRGVRFIKLFRINSPELLIDRDSMQKLMGNLLSNALKFTPDKGNVKVIASTYIDKKDLKEKLYVSVRDSGNGIPPSDIEKIFERFYQSKNQSVYSGSGQSGTGIGLYLCKKIVELYEGSIEATNHHSGGAAIRFIIPVESALSADEISDNQPVEEELIDIFEEQEESHDSKRKPLLLIVEDNSDMRKYIRSILSDEYNVLEASNGLAGLKQTKHFHPDLIISDIMMPEMDGIEFCKTIRSDVNSSHIPLVLLTAKSSTDTQIEAFQLGVDAYLVKPFDEDLLRAVIFNLSDKKKKTQQNFRLNMDLSVLNFEEDSPDKKFMDKAMKVVLENYTNPEFDVTEFIEEMGFSRSLLHKKLSTITGQSASRFIRTFRLNTAKELIIRNRDSHAMNISEIAYQVGFNDPKYFTRCFTKEFNIKPSSLLGEKN